MGETRDYLDAKRNDAIEEVREILDELESLGEEYRIDPIRLDTIKELVVEKGESIKLLHGDLDNLLVMEKLWGKNR